MGLSQSSAVEHAAPNSMDAATFIHQIKDLNKQSFGTEEEATKAYWAARALTARLESVHEAFWRRSFQEPANAMILMVASNLGIFRTMVATEKLSYTTDELVKGLKASGTNIDPKIMERMMKHLAAVYIVDEVGEKTYSMNEISKSLVLPEVEAGIRWQYSCFAKTGRHLPEWLQQNGYRLPNGRYDCATQTGLGNKLSFPDWMGEDKDASKDFDNLMVGYSANRPSVLAAVPYERLYGDYDGGVFMVDIGGSTGHDIKNYLKVFPDQPGKFVLQDLEHVTKVLKAKDLPRDTKVMTYDFFTPQPVYGAKLYLYHMILHGFTEEQSIDILSNVKPAMKKGYSKLLICDTVVPVRGGHAQNTAMDLIMLAMMGSLERTEKDWNNLLTKAGFKINHIWRKEGVLEGILECELA